MSEEERNQHIERGRAAYAERAWGDAYVALKTADASTPLPASELELLALCSGLSGHEGEQLNTLERLYHLHLREQPEAAARCAFWSGYRLLSLGEAARGAGWLGRAQRLVEQLAAPCVVSGYLLLAEVRRQFIAGDYASAGAAAERAASIGEQFGDRDLCVLARNLQARGLLHQGEVQRGLSLLDEALLCASDGELSPVVSGLVYCSALESCRAIGALDRAREWSDALHHFCEAQPQLVAFSNACLAYRAEMLQLSGALEEAVKEAQRITERAADEHRREGAGECFYQLGELHRLRAEVQAAEAAYQRATDFGRDPQPGLSLLRLTQGRIDQAKSAMRRVLAAAGPGLARARLLPAYVEVMLASAELDSARAAADELSQLCGQFQSPGIAASSAQAQGLVALEQGDAERAVAELTRAFTLFHELLLLYPAARARIALARACRALGDDDAARLQLAAARQELAAMGAHSELARLDAPSSTRSPATSNATSNHRLTPRELEVLRWVAQGKTNKAIASALHLSEKTIDRHVSNIFLKLGVATRAAATAFAYENALI